MFASISSMPALRKRLGASILLTLLCIASISYLLPTSRVSTRLQEIAQATSIDGSLWDWGTDEEGDEDLGGEGIRLVIFGDSWVDDTVEKGHEAKGKSWDEVLCEEINCTSRLNFAASQPFDAWPAAAPTGVVTSNDIHDSSLAQSTMKYIPVEPLESSPLPDIAQQIRTYISLPLPKIKPTETIFVISFGFWDIYGLSRLDYAVGLNGTATSINELFTQLDNLYNHFVANLTAPSNATRESNTEEIPAPSFRVVLPKVFDPTLLPGWLSLRPTPDTPSSVAEQQKNAVYLTERWNGMVENQVAAWVLTTPAPPAPITNSSRGDEDSPAFEPEEKTPKAEAVAIEKDVFYYDMPTLLLGIIIEHQLEDESLSDAEGLGTSSSPFADVYLPCLREFVEQEDTEGFADLNGMLVCKEPEEFLFWDSFNLGSVVKDMIGLEIGTMIKEGKSLRDQWKAGKNLGR